MDVRRNNNALKELNDCIGGLLHLGPNVITFRTLLHLGQLLHLGLQQFAPGYLSAIVTFFSPINIFGDVRCLGF